MSSQWFQLSDAEWSPNYEAESHERVSNMEVWTELEIKWLILEQQVWVRRSCWMRFSIMTLLAERYCQACGILQQAFTNTRSLNWFPFGKSNGQYWCDAKLSYSLLFCCIVWHGSSLIIAKNYLLSRNDATENNWLNTFMRNAFIPRQQTH